MYSLIARCISLAYSILSLLPKQNKISLFSRQGKTGSLDFRMLASAIETSCPEAKLQICATDPESKSKLSFGLAMPKMLYHAATSRVCVLEGYIPAVSIPDLDKQTCVIQLWHAMGAIKKFGYQSLGTEAGRSVEAADALGMHKNYDWIISAGKGAIPAYAEAFGYDQSRILPFGMPRMDYLLDCSAASPRLERAAQVQELYPWLASDVCTKILYVPTLRKGARYEGWMNREVERLSEAFSGTGCKIVVAGHPLDGGGDEQRARARENVSFVKGVSSIDLLHFADHVVTDYSAIAFEAGLLQKPVWFYVPDIEEYRLSPGLNIDPLIEFPRGAFSDPKVLAKGIIQANCPARQSDSSNDKTNDCVVPGCSDFADFMRRYFGTVREGSTEKLAIFVRECYLDTFENHSQN